MTFAKALFEKYPWYGRPGETISMLYPITYLSTGGVRGQYLTGQGVFVRTCRIFSTLASRIQEPQSGGTPQGSHVRGVTSQCSCSPSPLPAAGETPLVFTPTFFRQKASTWASLVDNAQQRLRPAAAPRSRSERFPAAAMSDSARAAGAVTV